MNLIKQLIFSISINILFTQNHVTIYNQGNAFIQKNNIEVNNQLGELILIIEGFPLSVDASSIEIFSENIEFSSKEYVYKPINIDNLLNSNINKEINLVSYSNEGNISYRTEGTLISNLNFPIFEIDGKIVIDPPYKYIFNDIPSNLKDFPYLNCSAIIKSKNSKYNLSYIASGFNWNAEYSINIKSMGKCSVEGWYYINNNNNMAFYKNSVSLVSGPINFYKKKYYSKNLNRHAMKTLQNSDNNSLENSHVTTIDDYTIFNIDDTINLEPNSKQYISFFKTNDVPYKKTYYINYNISKYNNYLNQTIDKLPINTKIELLANDIASFQLPSGNYKVYENTNENKIFIGSNHNKIISENQTISIDTGKSHDVLCDFTFKEHNITRNNGRINFIANFKNFKDTKIEIEFVLNLNDSRWIISKSNIKYEKIDASKIKFIINIDANSDSQLNLQAHY